MLSGQNRDLPGDRGPPEGAVCRAPGYPHVPSLEQRCCMYGSPDFGFLGSAHRQPRAIALTGFLFSRFSAVGAPSGQE